MYSAITIISIILLCFALLLTIFQQIRKDEWWVRLSDFPHVQLLVLTAVSWTLLAVTMSSLDFLTGSLLIAGLAAIIYQLRIVLPYTRLSKPQVADTPVGAESTQISLLEANVFMDNRSYKKMSDCIHRMNPDLFIGLETDQAWCDYLVEAHPEYSYGIMAPLDNTYGMILLSKIPLEDKQTHYRVEEGVPSFTTNLCIDNNCSVRLDVLHPAPPSPTENDYSTERDAEILIVAKEVRDLENPVIVAGDLNDVAWSHTTRLFQRISGLLDPRIGRGLFNTYHAKWPWMRWPLDHIFHSNHFTLNSMERCSDIGSDHFPMYISLDLNGHIAQTKNTEPEEKDYTDEIEANEKIEKVKEAL